MIYNAYKLMCTLKKIADTDKDSIFIDYKNSRFFKVYDGTEPFISQPFPKNEPSVRGLLHHLRDGGFITLEEDEEYCSLTYKALYYGQIIWQKRLSYVLRSIFVPIILSIITSILTTTFLPELLSALLETLQKH